jgi:hypothetical protein
MMLRVVVTAVLLFAVLAGAKHERVLERAHIVGSCATYARGVDGSEWRQCSSGRISGRPSLRRNGCTDAGPHRDVELWHCPAQLASSNIRP